MNRFNKWLYDRKQRKGLKILIQAMNETGHDFGLLEGNKGNTLVVNLRACTITSSIPADAIPYDGSIRFKMPSHDFKFESLEEITPK